MEGKSYELIGNVELHTRYRLKFIIDYHSGVEYNQEANILTLVSYIYYTSINYTF